MAAELPAEPSQDQLAMGLRTNAFCLKSLNVRWFVIWHDTGAVAPNTCGDSTPKGSLVFILHLLPLSHWPDRSVTISMTSSLPSGCLLPVR